MTTPTDRLTEIKARVAQTKELFAHMRAKPKNAWWFSDLEYALAEIERLTQEIAAYEGPRIAELLSENTQFMTERDRLRAALLGLLTFRTNKDYWECFSDEQLKPLLDDAFAKARAALEESK